MQDVSLYDAIAPMVNSAPAELENDEEKLLDQMMQEIAAQEELEEIGFDKATAKKQTKEHHTDYKCNICLEMVLEKDQIFGLLDKCDHHFCLDCIREWRATYI